MNQKLTFCVDVGGNKIKAAAVNDNNEIVTERIAIKTPRPIAPSELISIIKDLQAQLPACQRASVGVPVLIRNGIVRFVANLSRDTTGNIVRSYADQWRGFDLQTALSVECNIPVKVLNDADMQGNAIISSTGVEFVITLGTGVGTALFNDGNLIPHLELGHAVFEENQTFEERLGVIAFKSIPEDEWKQRVCRALEAYDKFLFYDHCYIGGGRSSLLHDMKLNSKTTLASNIAGIIGGAFLWKNQKNT